uniref:NAD-dependent epimerase/dehydratase domain-containing protein n=2 Tax=Oryza TaxID=4527 RepID=A0A0D3FXG5_9ORYZ
MLTEALLPLFRRSPATSRILNISSQLGLLNKVSDPELKRLLQDEERLTEAEVEGMASRFLAQVKDGTWRGQGWPKVWTDYSVSKLALNAYARVLARRLQARGDRVSVNCFCPGFTRTDMTRGWGKRTAEEAAEIGVRLALLPPGELPTGTFFKWCTPQLYSKL